MAFTKAPPGHFTILYFASASSYTSKDTETFEAPLKIGELFEVLDKKYAGMRSKVLDSCLITINLEYVDIADGDDETTATIHEGDEVAIIPPVSSG